MNERIQPGVDDIKARHIKRQLQHKRMMKRRRTIFFTVLTIIFISIILFFTPLFNIKHINIYGNIKLETAVIKQKIGSVEEENLFRLNTKKIIKEIKTLPYTDDVKIKKKLIPSSLEVTVLECVPIGFVFYNEQYIILDKNFKVLEILDTKIENLGEISGLEITSATPGAILAVDDTEKLTSCTQCILELINQELIFKIGKIDFSDMSDILFTYENRLNVVCGSTVDFAKKIGMFSKAVSSSKLTADSRGTIDISISGKAIYTP